MITALRDGASLASIAGMMRAASLVMLVGCGTVIEGIEPDAGADAPVSAPPTAAVVFPTASALVYGIDYPVIVAGDHTSGLARLEVVIDGTVVDGGLGVPTLWRSTPGGAEAGAASVEQIAESGSFEFVIPARLTQKVIGLGDVDTGGVLADVDVGFYFTPLGFNLVGGAAGIRKYGPGDVFRIDVTAAAVEWRLNGVAIATGARPAGALHVEAWMPGDGSAIMSPRIAIAGQPATPVTWTGLVNTTTSTAFATMWSSTTRGDGTVAIAARATAAAGGSADSAAVVVGIDNTVPTCSLLSPAAGRVGGTVLLDGRGADAHLTTLVFYIDGRLHSQHDGQAAASSAWDTEQVPNGAHKVELRAYDNAGHTAECSVEVTVVNL